MWKIFRTARRSRAYRSALPMAKFWGFAGLVGAGRTETMRMIFGADKRTSGDIYLNGQKIEIRSPQDSVKHKIAFVTENRKTEGLLLNKSVYLNIVMVALNKIKKGGLINHKLELQYSQQYIKELHIATPDENKRVIFLSGGNQQKIVVAKWLMSDSEVTFSMNRPEASTSAQSVRFMS